MSDDTTTWLKKNPSINPLRRSLKTSLRFHVPNSDMNTSIMSNPDKAHQEQGLFIPRMLQRTNIRKSRAHEFKVPDFVVSKPAAKKESSGAKVKKVPTPNNARKSFLPVPKTKGPTKPSQPRPSFVPPKVPSARRTTAKRELLKKVVELSEIKRREEAGTQVQESENSSALRSILKKRASLRRTSRISEKKPKAKKVLFDGFENSDGEKENVDVLLESQNDFNTALDEPTVFLNFPNKSNAEDSLFDPGKSLNWTVEDTRIISGTEIDQILKLWETYKENLDSIQTGRNSLEDAFESLLEHSLNFQKEYKTYKENSEEIYGKLSRLGDEIQEKLNKALCPESTPTPSRRRSSGKKEKIKMSDKSKAIRKNSGRKSLPLIKKDFLSDMEDSFSLISKNRLLEK